jgi:hypothetical protein
MADKDFAGLNGLTWWIGVVEDRKDPLKLNRSRVRIQGWHPDNKTELPTEHLPWASILVSPSTSRVTAGPKENDWVQGFFMDGDSAQYPVIFGVLPGINTKVVEVAGAPKPPADVKGDVAGEPSTARIARGVMEGTLIDKTNNDRKHVCDITGQITPVVLYLKNKYGIIATEIREIIRKILKALGFDPSGESSALISYIKKITNFLSAIAEMLEEVLDWKRLIVDVAAAAKAMIDYIMSLPERLYNLFKKCLKNLYAQLYAAFKFITDVGTEDKLFSEDPELKEALKELEDTGKILRDQTKELLNAPQDILNAATKPASQESLDEIESLILEAVPSNDEVSGNAGYDQTKQEKP